MSTDNIEANREKFVGEHAQQYDNESTFRIGHEITREILQFPNPDAKSSSSIAAKHAENGDIKDVSTFWDPDTTRVLDFACGTGIISSNLSPHVKQVVGVDIASDMIDIFNNKVHNQGIPEAEVQGYLLNIFEPEDVEKGRKLVPGGMDNFDAAVTSLAYHHIDDIDMASSALYDRIKPKGWVYVADLSLGPGFEHSHEKDQVVPHHGGFLPETIEKSLTKAGFVNVESNNIFAVSLWATEEYIGKFQKFHTTSRMGDDDESKSFKEIHGMRIYDEKEEKGEKKYLIKKRMLLVVGQHP